MSDFSPRIVAFVCNWCSYAGADQAGGKKLECPPEIALVRLMCSGRADPQLAMDAFREGADGVLVLGCHPGDCHYHTGNYAAMRRFRLLTRLLPQFGIEAARFRLDWVAAGEGERFQQVASSFTEVVRALGPLHLRGFVSREVAS